MQTAANLKRLKQLLLCLGSLAIALPLGAEPNIRVNTQIGSAEFGQVQVTGIDREQLSALAQQQLNASEWQKILSVQLLPQKDAPELSQLPNVLGRYQVSDLGLSFSPKFAPTGGLGYHIQLELGDEIAKIKTVAFDMTSPIETAPAVIERIYPDTDSIPENTLRLYVQFDQPMARGQAMKNIALLDERGEVIDKAFIIAPLGELWNREQTRLTLLLDPGRIKQGVAPNRELGPALKAGSVRTLSIAGQFKDANGNAIGKEYRRTYKISEPLRSAINPRDWIVTSPPSATVKALQIQFARALDSAMLARSIRIYDASGTAIAGDITFNADQTQWRYSPRQPWAAGEYRIRIETQLEDISGNNLKAPLDVKTGANNRTVNAGYIDLSFTPRVPLKNSVMLRP